MALQHRKSAWIYVSGAKHNERGDEHVHAVEVEVEDFILEVLQEMLFGFLRVAHSFQWVAHFYGF